MTSQPFHSRMRSVLAGILSLVTLVAVSGYVFFMPTPEASIAATYSDSGRPLITGTVKSDSGKPIRGARVTLVFRADGAFLERDRVKTGKRGHWRAEIPEGAESVAVAIRKSGAEGAPRAVAQFGIRPGQAMELTAVFTPRSTGLIPAIFPY